MKSDTNNAKRFGACAAAFIFCLGVCDAGINVSNLPPAAMQQIDFACDIQPMLEENCLRCHGPEKPRSGFRLDNRDAALKGGDGGPDILPGNSAHSPLIHYVAHLVEDMEMPPVGKGNPLTTNEVSLLRAWIDQGANWNAPFDDTLKFSFTPVFGDSIVSGDKQKFREYYWQKDGAHGGVEDFELLQQTSPDTKWLLNGHALLDDYKINLAVDRNNLGFVHTGWEQYRKYDDDIGGYSPALVSSAPGLNQDLYLDIGKAWIDLGLTLPDWPVFVLGYEFDYRRGNEATTEWSAIGTSPNKARNISPASFSVNEGVHILKFDMTDEIAGVAVKERFRGEFYHLRQSGTNVAFSQMPQSTSEHTSYFQGANTIELTKSFNDWLYGSAGYLYSKLNSDASATVDFPALLQQASLPQIILERESNVGNLNGLLGPFNGLIVSTGVQAEWTRQHGFGNGTFEAEIPPPPFSDLLIPFTVASDYDKASLQENLSLRYSKIPFTTLFAEARTEQQDIGQNDQFASAQNILNKAVFLQHTAFTSQSSDLRFGFSTSPWRVASFDAHYRRYEDDSRYDSDPLVQPIQTGYPTFIRSRNLITDEIEAKTILRLTSRFKTILSYQYQATDYGLDTGPYNLFGTVISPGGELMAGNERTHIFSINGTFTPISRLYLSATFSYQISSLTTDAGGSPAVVPYRGDIYTVLADGTYVLSQTTDLIAGYFFSKANYGQNNFTAGQPLGIQFQRHSVQFGLTRRFDKNISSSLRYRFDYYNEPSSGGAGNYRAHSIFGTLTFRFP